MSDVSKLVKLDDVLALTLSTLCLCEPVKGFLPSNRVLCEGCKGRLEFVQAVSVLAVSITNPRTTAAVAVAEKFCVAMRLKRSGNDDPIATKEAMRQLRVAEVTYLESVK